MTTPENPYQPPVADLQPQRDQQDDNSLLDEPRRLPFLAGARWIGAGGQLFGRSWGMFILMFIIAFAISMAFQFIPIVNLLFSLLYFVLVGGWMVACQRAWDGETALLEDLFAGFRNNFGSLVLLGLLYLAFTVVFVILMFVVMFPLTLAMGGGIGDGDGPGALFFVFLFVFIVLITLPPLMAVWFAPALIILNDQDVLTAVRQSFFGCLRNILPFLLYALLALLLLIAGSLPLLLGLLVVMPLLACSVYASYRDIYIGE